MWRHLVERRIQEAMERGDFDGLPGLGKPIPDLDAPYDPMWWVRDWMRRERLDSERLMQELAEERGASSAALLRVQAIREARDVAADPS